MSATYEQEHAADPLESIPTLPEEPVTRQDILLRAAELIEEHGWERGTRVTREGRLCLVGAVCEAGGHSHNDPDSAYDFAYKVVGSHICDLWNDEQKSPAAVTGALRRLASGATWKEATLS